MTGIGYSPRMLDREQQSILPGFPSLRRAKKAKTGSLPLASRPAVATLCKFVNGDVYDVAANLEPKSLDLIITSPPYWGLRTYGGTHNWDILNDWKKASKSGQNSIPSYDWYRSHGGLLGLEPLPEWYVSHLVEIFTRLKPALKSSGSIWINIGDTYFARWASLRDSGRQGLGDNTRVRRRVPMGGYRQEKQLLQIPARFAIAMQDSRWILRNDLIWFKPNVPPRPEKDRLRLSHEHFYHFVHRPTSGRAKYYYDMSCIPSGCHDVVECNVRPGESEHSATFPRELIEPRILSSCPPNGVVLDPFCGTARAIVVAAENGRNGIGIELNKTYLPSMKEGICLSVPSATDNGK